MSFLKKFAAVLGFFLLPVISYAAYGGITWGYDSSLTSPKLSVLVNGTWKEVAFYSNGNFFSITSEFDITRYGADPTGATSSSSAIASAMSTGSREVKVPCGTFLIDTTLKIPSNTKIKGSGDCSVIKLSASIVQTASNYQAVLAGPAGFASGGAAIENSDYSSGNSGIYISDVKIDGQLDMPQPMHVFAYYKVSNYSFKNVHVVCKPGAGGEAYTAFANIQTSSGVISGNFTENCKTGVGVWDGSSKLSISDNIIDGGGYGNNGIVVNGTATNYVTNTTTEVSVIGNQIKNLATGAVGIDMSGLWNGVSGGGATYGVVKNSSVIGNNILVGSSVGIRLAEGEDLVAAHNTIDGCGTICISVASGNLGTTKRVTVEGNHITGANSTSTANIDAIRVGNASDAPEDVSLVSNLVGPGNHRFAVRIQPNALRTSVIAGPMTAGTSGTLSDGGTQSFISQFESDIAVSTSSNLPKKNFVNLTNDATAGFFNFQKQRAGAIVAVNDTLGSISFQGYDGAVYREGARISSGVTVSALGTIEGSLIHRVGGVNTVIELKGKTVNAVPIVLPHYSAAGTAIPACDATLKYAKAYVDDATQTLTAGIGAVYASGGANVVPVGCDGTNWLIGG